MLLSLPGARQNAISFRQMFASGLVGGLGGAASYHAMSSAMKVCFAAGTRLRVLRGWRKIEEIGVGDCVLSRAEHDVSGEVESKRVEAVFVREGLLMRLRDCTPSG